MEDKLQELTQRIYQEGVIKAKDEAELILADARKKADEIIQQAKQTAAQTQQNAMLETQELKKNITSEIKLAAEQLLTALKQKVTDLVVTQALTDAVSQNWKNSDFMQKLIVTLFENWSKGDSNVADMNLILPEDLKNEMTEFFKSQVNQELQKKVKITFTDRMHNGFMIEPSKGGYRISFTDDDFIELFRSYLRPKAINILYGE